MKTRALIAVTAGLTLALAGAGAAAADATPTHTSDPVGAVFVQTDDPAGNAVVAFDRFADGTLAQAGTYATGGAGGTLAGSVVDRTASEGSVVRSGGSLLVVNAGSDSVTSFRVLGSRLLKLETVASGGDFPVSIASHGNRVFVLNARGGGSIQGYLNIGGLLVEVPAWHRSLGFDPNATPEFTHTPAQVAFTPDGTKLVVSTKGNTSAFDVFAVSRLGLSQQPVVTPVPNAVPFGFGFDAAGTLVASEAGPNAVASFTVNPDGTLTKLAEVATGQKATCWIAVDGERVFASNAGSGTLSGFGLGAGGALTAITTTPTDAGTVDATTTPDGRFLYVQAGAAGIVDEFAVQADGTLHRVGSVTVPDAVGAEGIVAG